jgi:hypothetical protein
MTSATASGVRSLDLRQQQNETNKFYMAAFWLNTACGLIPFLVASGLKWVPFPFGPFLVWFGERCTG